MKLFGILSGVLLVPALCSAQMMSSHPQAATGTGSPHGAGPSSRAVFGKECGIADVSTQKALIVSRSPEGAWSVVNEQKRPGPTDNALARLWRESKWMVDLQVSPGNGTTFHVAQMCFDPQGKISRMIDRYFDVADCKCERVATLSFDGSGKVIMNEQKFMNPSTGEEIAAPEAAKGFPAVFGFRKLEQLPFYSLVKK